MYLVSINDDKEKSDLLHFLLSQTCLLSAVSTVSTVKLGVTEKRGVCVKLRDQLETLERETSAKLAEMDRYSKDMQVNFSSPFNSYASKSSNQRLSLNFLRVHKTMVQ